MSISANLQFTTITGEIRAATVNGQVSAATLSSQLSASSPMGSIEINGVVVKKNLPDYVGEYSVTPSTNGKELETANMSMTGNIVVQPIPFFEVSNEYGKTIYIGGDA